VRHGGNRVHRASEIDHAVHFVDQLGRTCSYHRCAEQLSRFGFAGQFGEASGLGLDLRSPRFAERITCDLDRDIIFPRPRFGQAKNRHFRMSKYGGQLHPVVHGLDPTFQFL